VEASTRGKATAHFLMAKIAYTSDRYKEALAEFQNSLRD